MKELILLRNNGDGRHVGQCMVAGSMGNSDRKQSAFGWLVEARKAMTGIGRVELGSGQPPGTQPQIQRFQPVSQYIHNEKYLREPSVAK